MKKYSLLFLSTIVFLFAHSQDFLVPHHGDTLHGNIKFMGKTISIDQAGRPDTIYAADDVAYIKTRGYTGTVFHCGLVIYSDNIDVVQKFNYNGGSENDTVMILHEIYSTPKMTLFEAPDKGGSMYYFIKKPEDKLPVQMIVHFFINIRQDYFVSILTQQRIYADQLRVIMGDCPKITEADLEMMDYRGYSFKKIIRLYNKCK